MSLRLTERIKRLWSKEAMRDEEHESACAILIPRPFLQNSEINERLFDLCASDIAKSAVKVYGHFFDCQKQTDESCADYVFARDKTVIKYAVRVSDSGFECCALIIDEPKLRVTHASLLISDLLESHLIVYREDCKYKAGLFCLLNGKNLHGGEASEILGVAPFSFAKYVGNGLYEETVIEEW